MADGSADRQFDLDSEVDIEPMPAEWLDVADVAAQYLSLALDPYPREADYAELSEVEDFAALSDRHDGAIGFDDRAPAEGEKQNPFAALKKLQQ